MLGQQAVDEVDSTATDCLHDRILDRGEMLECGKHDVEQVIQWPLYELLLILS